MPNGAQKAGAYFCVPMDASLAARSSVMETLMEMQGIAEVPQGVSFEDFLAWATSDVAAAWTRSDDAIARILAVGVTHCYKYIRQ